MPRGEAIIIPGVGRWSAKLEHWLNRREPGEPDRPTAPTNDTQEPGLQGYACVYDRPFIKNGKIMMFANGCFAGSVYGGPPKSILFDHDDSNVIGTTADGLEFANNLEGLVYRLPLRGNRRSAEVERGIRTGTKGCASVGCNIVESRDLFSDGVAYTLVTRATLHEVSLVPQGAVSGTSASIVDLANEPRNLRAAARGLTFKLDKMASNMTTDCRRLMDRLDRVAALLRQA